MHFLHTDIRTFLMVLLERIQDISSLMFVLLILMACMFYKAVLPLRELQKLDAGNLEVEGLKTQLQKVIARASLRKIVLKWGSQCL